MTRDYSLLFGETTLNIRLPEGLRPLILASRDVPELPQVNEAIQKALLEPIATPPLSQMAQGKNSACIIVCDHTRPAPTRSLLPPILRTLEDAGLSAENITLLIATGLHRPSTKTEKDSFLGAEMANRYSVVCHQAEDLSALEQRDSPPEKPVWINRHLLNADLKIATGLIEPHLSAGYSGGCKLITPGVSGLQTIRALHGAGMMDDPRLVPGQTLDNPFLEMTRQIARMAGLDFIVNVTLNHQRKITGVFAGQPVAAHEAGIRFKAESSVVTVNRPVDLAITCGGGAPLDRTLYQTVKGVCGAAPIVRRGGTILVASACNEGLGSTSFQDMMENSPDMEDFLRQIHQPEFFRIDQWCVQQFFTVMLQKKVYFHTPHLPPEQLARCHFHPAPQLQEAVDACLSQYAPQPGVAVIPEGPYVVCRLEEGVNPTSR